MEQYHNHLSYILNQGHHKSDRTGTGTLSTFGLSMRFDLQQGFPLITTKKMFTKGIIHELIWFLSGNTNIQYLLDHGVHIWDDWADAEGNLGPVYGKQWRSWTTLNGQSIDQISNLIERLKNDPHSRRHIISAWNVGELEQMALPPCHLLFQFYVADGKLSCSLYQRSCDMFLGVPFNIASYSLLLHMVAQQTNLNIGEFVWFGGDCHIYENHIEQVKTQLSRRSYPLPTLELNKAKSLFDYSIDDITIHDYQHHPSIKAPIAV